MSGDQMLTTMVMGGVAVAGAWIWARHREKVMQHQERLAALDKGVAVLPEGSQPHPWSPRVYLLRGLIWSAVGVSLTIAMLAVLLSPAAQRKGDPMSPFFLEMEAKRLTKIQEMPIEEARSQVAKREAQRMERIAQETPPVAISLFGLIPLSVGLAYIAFYRSGQNG